MRSRKKRRKFPFFAQLFSLHLNPIPPVSFRVIIDNVFFLRIIIDSVYTERLMGLPAASDNQAGYARSLLLNKVDNFKNKGYYLIHGTLDDNVHYQQSMMLAKMLEQKDILFRQQVSFFVFAVLELLYMYFM